MCKIGALGVLDSGVADSTLSMQKPCPCKNAGRHTYSHSYRRTHTQTYRHADRQIYRHPDIQAQSTDRQTCRQTDVQASRHTSTDRQTDRQTEIHARYMYAHVRMRLTQWNMSRRSSGPEWQEAGLQGCLKLHSSKSKRRSISGFGALLVGVLFWESRAVRR